MVPQRQTLRYTFGRRINPWWPLVEVFGGRWQVKWRPILLFVLALESAFIVWQQHYIRHLRAAATTPAAINAKAIARAYERAQVRHKASVNTKKTLTRKPAIPRALPAPVAVHPAASTPAPLARPRAEPPPHPRATPQAHPVARTVAPEIFGLFARFRGPSELRVSFVRRGVIRVDVSASDGVTTVARLVNVGGSSADLSLPAGYASPALVEVVGTSRDGETIRRSVWVPKYTE